MAEVVVKGFCVKGEKCGKVVATSRTYHSIDAVQQLAAMMSRSGEYDKVYVADIVGVEGSAKTTGVQRSGGSRG